MFFYIMKYATFSNTIKKKQNIFDDAVKETVSEPNHRTDRQTYQLPEAVISYLVH